MTKEQQQQFVRFCALCAAQLREDGVPVAGALVALKVAAGALLATVFGLEADHPQAEAIAEFAARAIEAALHLCYSPQQAQQQPLPLQA